MKQFFKRAFVNILIVFASFALLAFFGATSVFADSGSPIFDYVLGTGPLCSLEPTACPDITKASNGDIVQITGQGTINTKDKTVTGGGTFVHKDKSGNVKGSGTWSAERLISFRSYGSGASQGLPANFEGGRAKLEVMLTSSTGLTFMANLKIDCLLGNPPAGAKEGITLTVRREGNFHEIVSGDTLFIKTL